MEEKINLLYNFLYNNSFQNCFDIDKIHLGKININDIKITDSNEVKELFNELNNAKFSYIDYDEKENLIYLKRFSDSYPVTVKIGTYQSNINELNNPSNNDSLFSYLLSQLVLYKKSKHILLPILNFDIEFNYDQVVWETGDFQGGNNGLGGTSAAVGFTGYTLPGSGVPGTFLDNGTNPLTEELSPSDIANGSGVPGRYIFSFRNSPTPITTPESGSLVMLGVFGLSCLTVLKR